MAKVLVDPLIEINSVDLSGGVASVTLSTNVADVTTTNFGSSGNVTRVAGLKDSSISLEFHNDWSSSDVSQTISALVGSTTTVVVKPVNDTTTATNPSYTMTVLVTEWPYLDGAVGDLATASVTWPVTGAITEATS